MDKIISWFNINIKLPNYVYMIIGILFICLICYFRVWIKNDILFWHINIISIMFTSLFLTLSKYCNKK